MMNKKLFFCTTILGCIISLCSVRVRGDEFEDFIQSCERISKNYKQAKAVEGSRFTQEYLKYLRTMQQQAAYIQRCTNRLKLGQDFQFTALVAELEKIFHENKNARIGKNRFISENPNGILRILLFDVKELHKMEFTTEGGGSIKPSLERKRRLLEMKRLVNFFSRFRMAAMQNRDPSLQTVFNLRAKRMLSLSLELEYAFRKFNKNSRNSKTLNKEISLLLTDHNLLVKDTNKRRSSSKKRRHSSNRRKKTEFVTKLKKSEFPKVLEQNIRISLRNIHDILTQWESFNVSSDRPLKRKEGSREKDPSAALSRNKDADEDLQSMSRRDLYDKLLALRKEILKGNSSIDGLDPATERKYLRTLSRDQVKMYRGILKKLQDQGYENKVAARNAVLRTQFEITLSKKIPEKKELVKIFENIRKDKIREKENIRF